MALQALQSFIAGLDKNGTLGGLSYSMSFNQQLGYGSDPFSPFQFIPYGTWDNYEHQPDPLPSVLEQAFRDTVVIGHSLDGNSDTKHSFIDILHLEQPDPIFFTEPLLLGPDKGSSLIQVIANAVNSMDPSANPVIRFLVGNPAPPGQRCPEEYTDVFWPNGTTIFTHPNAMLYIGTFNPNISLAQDLESDIDSWVDSLLPQDEILQWVQSLNLSTWEQDVADIAINATFYFLNFTLNGLVNDLIGTYFAENVTPLSWNHAKIVAVNGRALLTGGGNYYDLYSTKGNGTLIDNDITVLGDAARSAHNYSDYLWSYLNSPHSASDPSSLTWSSPLNVTAPTGGIPLGDKAPTFPPDIPGLRGNVPVLSTAKVGNFDPITGVAYPAQILDAVRDILYQIVYAYGPVDWWWGPGKVNLLPLIATYTTDTYLQGDLADLGVSPASWASRIARIKAIQGATDHIYLSQQMLVNWDMTGVDAWNKAVAQINGEFNTNWDGKVWPFDLLMALSQAIATIETDHPTEQDKGIYVVLSERDWVNGQGYQDNTTIAELTARLVDVMGGMVSLGLLGDNLPFGAPQVADVVSRRFHVKRSVLFGPPPSGMSKKLHTKVVDVDGRLLFTGSDNAYPQWNEQFGVWIEDAERIAAWEKGFFLGLWERALEVQ